MESSKCRYRYSDGQRERTGVQNVAVSVGAQEGIGEAILNSSNTAGELRTKGGSVKSDVVSLLDLVGGRV